jgi:hypothetical protein
VRGVVRSWTTTVQGLGATMAIYHIRYLFVCDLRIGPQSFDLARPLK